MWRERLPNGLIAIGLVLRIVQSIDPGLPYMRHRDTSAAPCISPLPVAHAEDKERKHEQGIRPHAAFAVAVTGTQHLQDCKLFWAPPR